MAEKPDKTMGSGTGSADRDALDHIARALRDLQFGEVTATVQDGVVLQVERTERFRFSRGSPKH